MTSTLILALLGTTGAGAILSAVVNGVLNRRKLSADATEIISRAAAGVVERLEKENTRMLGVAVTQIARVTALEHDADRLRTFLHIHERWDENAVHLMRLHGIDISDPPPLAPPD